MASKKLKRAEVTIRKRVECEERAFHIVNKLVDACVDVQYLSECGKRISQANYDDIVEERAIIKLCGYPLCNQNLPNVPKKKYHISTTANKVYDISERKKFCSNQCFKASNSFKKQIPESPVWAREEENIKILIAPHQGLPGQVGDEVIGERLKNVLERELEKLQELDNQFVVKGKDHDEKSVLTEKDRFKETCVLGNEEHDSTNGNASRLDLVCEEFNKSQSNEMKDSTIVEDLHNDFEKLDVSNHSSEQTKSLKRNSVQGKESFELVVKEKVPEMHDKCGGGTQASSKLELLQTLLKKRKEVLSGMVDLQETKVAKDDPVKSSGSCDVVSENKSQRNQKIIEASNPAEKCIESTPSAAVQSPLCLICQVLKKWVSIGTVEYLQFKSSDTESVVSVAEKFSDLQIQVDCANLSKKLEIQEKQFGGLLDEDGRSDADNEDCHNKMKNVPDDQVLKDEAEQFQLKVTEFITGKKPKQNMKEKDNGSEDAVYIPTVDAYDQSQLRAKIVLERLDKSLPDLLIPMGLTVQDVSSYLRELIYTFRLERDTITFKPAEWILVSLLLLKMLSFRIKAVQEAFNKDSTIRHFSALLKGIKHTMEDVDANARQILAGANVIFNPSR